MSDKNIEELLKKLNHNIFLWLLTNSKFRHMFSSLVVLDYNIDDQHLFFDINNKTIPYKFTTNIIISFLTETNVEEKEIPFCCKFTTTGRMFEYNYSNNKKILKYDDVTDFIIWLKKTDAELLNNLANFLKQG